MKRTWRSNGPARVLGGAGTGKTVVLMHRARALAKNVFKASAGRVLVTTFTRNLASAIGDNLKTLCGDERNRIEVLHVDALAACILRAHGVTFTPANQEHLAECWESAVAAAGDLKLPVGFYREEWSRVDAEGVRVATMHRVKGLEFQSVIIAGANEGVLPLPTAIHVGDDAEVKEEAVMRERCLLYVAASRARDFLSVSAAGRPSPFLVPASG